MITQTCKGEINRKIQHKHCLCVIRLCSLGLIKFGSFRHQIYWTSCSWNLFLLWFHHRTCSTVSSTLWPSFVETQFLFLSLNRSFPLDGKYVSLWRCTFHQTKRWKGFSPDGKNEPIFLDMSKSVVGWKDTETVHNLIRHPLVLRGDMASAVQQQRQQHID